MSTAPAWLQFSEVLHCFAQMFNTSTNTARVSKMKKTSSGMFLYISADEAFKQEIALSGDDLDDYGTWMGSRSRLVL